MNSRLTDRKEQHSLALTSKCGGWTTKQSMKNASLDTLYKHYHAWLESLDPRTRICNYPQNYMFLVVDAEVMQRIRETDVKSLAGLPLEQHPFVKVFDGKGLSGSDDDDYPGWMKLRLSGLYYLYEKGLRCWGMRELCVKDTMWFERDAHPEQTYYVESDDSDSSTSDDEVDSKGQAVWCSTRKPLSFTKGRWQ